MVIIGSLCISSAIVFSTATAGYEYIFSIACCGASSIYVAGYVEPSLTLQLIMSTFSLQVMVMVIFPYSFFPIAHHGFYQPHIPNKS